VPVSERFLFAMLILVSATLVLFTILFTFPTAAKFVLVVVALLLDVLAFSTKFYAQFFTPFLHMKGRTVTLKDSEAFTLAPTGNAIIVRSGGDTYASAFVKIPSYRSATEMNPEEKVDFTKLFSRVMTLSKTPVKFAAQLYVINKDSYIGNIRNRLNEAEEKYGGTSLDKGASKEAVERIKGEVTMWHNLFDHVSKTQSRSLEAYAMITSQGGNEEEAVNLALQKADEVATGVSALFGIGATIMEGEEMLKFVEPDYIIPVVTAAEQIRGATMEKEV
jgi:hypothetical protein